MVIGGQVYELLFATQEARWYLKPIVSSRSMA